MASAAEPSQVLCSLCNKAKGIYKCSGCSQAFCPKHSNDHRNELNKQLEEIAVEHDLVHQTLNQQTEDPQQHHLIKEINKWEKIPLTEFRKTAEKVRNAVFQDATEHVTQVKQRLQVLSKQLRQSREDDDFSENDLRQWTQKLSELKKELLNPTTVRIEEDSTSLVNNLRIARQDALDVFERVCGNAEIKENRRLIVKVGTNGDTEIRGKSEYTTGRHTLHFRMKQLQRNTWIFFGIISKSEPMRAKSYNSPSTYGWATANQTYVAGQNTREETLEIVENDSIILSIDIDQRKIELRNTRLNQTKTLTVDINRCPLPWQFHLNLYASNTQVRIMDSSN